MRVKLNPPPIDRARGTSASVAAAKPKLKSTAPASTPAPIDAHDGTGTARAGDAPAHGEVRGGAAQQSAVHARMKALDDGRIANVKKAPTPESHPQLFWNGKQKWKAPPPNVTVVVNTDNVDGGGWIEKWQKPDGKWVHNYTLEEMARKAGEKFVKNAGFARNINELRMQLAKDLRGPLDDKQTRVALAVAVIDRTFIRVGNESSTKRSQGDADKQDTYGVTTMLAKHVSIEGEKAVFRFVGKSEVAHEKVILDPRLVKMLAALKARAGDDGAQLFAGVDASDVNAWLEPFGGTAKSFRTYHATRLAADGFRQWHNDHPNASPAEREAIVDAVIAEVAERVGHTPQVCRGSYVDPAVVALFVRGKMS